MKSPLPSLATLHTLPTASAITIASAMKPAPPPSKPVGEPLKYASAAAAAAATDRAGVGIAPLPPPPLAPGTVNTALPTTSSSPSATNSPAVATAQLAKTPALDKSHVTTAIQAEKPASRTLTPAISHSSANAATPSPGPGSAQLLQNSVTDDVPSTAAQTRQAINEVTKALDGLVVQNHERNNESALQSAAAKPALQANGTTFDTAADSDGESVYHLPAVLQELVDSYEAVKTSAPAIGSAEHAHYLAESFRNRPDNFDAEKPRHYKPENPALYTPRTTLMNHCRSSTILDYTAKSIPMHSFTLSITGRAPTSNTLPPRHYEGSAGAFTSNIRRGSSGMRSPNTFPKTMSRARIASLTTKAHGELCEIDDSSMVC